MHFPKAYRRLLTLGLILSIPGLAAAQARSFQESIEKTVLTHPEVRARFHDFQSSLEGQNITRGALLPEVNAQGWTGREWRGSTSEHDSANWNRNGYSLELRQLLFDGFSTTSR